MDANKYELRTDAEYSREDHIRITEPDQQRILLDSPQWITFNPSGSRYQCRLRITMKRNSGRSSSKKEIR